MAKGDKPAIRISARPKNAAKGARVSVDLLAGWNGEHGINFVLDTTAAPGPPAVRLGHAAPQQDAR